MLHVEQGSGRRSSRLTARTVKAAEDVRLAEQTAAEAAEAATAAYAFAGPPGGCLLDACSAAELALIANQACPDCSLRLRTSCQLQMCFGHICAACGSSAATMQRLRWICGLQVLELRAAAPEARSGAEPPDAVTQAAAAVSFSTGGEVSLTDQPSTHVTEARWAPSVAALCRALCESHVST